MSAPANRTPDGIATGKVMSSQCMFHTALQTERYLGIDFWSADCPTVDGIRLTVPGPDGSKALHWAARLDAPAQPVDQPVKISRWMQAFEQRGGKFLHDASAEDLEEYVTDNDLVLVAAGKADIASLFERDEEKSPYDKPQRAPGGSWGPARRHATWPTPAPRARYTG